MTDLEKKRAELAENLRLTGELYKRVHKLGGRVRKSGFGLCFYLDVDNLTYGVSVETGFIRVWDTRIEFAVTKKGLCWSAFEKTIRRAADTQFDAVLKLIGKASS
jgi:hypothetical protein